MPRPLVCFLFVLVGVTVAYMVAVVNFLMNQAGDQRADGNSLRVVMASAFIPGGRFGGAFQLEKLVEVGLQNHEWFARKHGYDFEWIDQMPPTSRDIPTNDVDKTQCFAKFAWLEHAVRRGRHGVVFWNDIDSMFTQRSKERKSFQMFIEFCEALGRPVIVAAECPLQEDPARIPRPMSGNLALLTRSLPPSFFDEWMSLIPFDHNCDQDGFQLLYQRHPEWFCLQHHSTFMTYPEQCTAPESSADIAEPLLVHFPGPEKGEALKSFIEKHGPLPPSTGNVGKKTMPRPSGDGTTGQTTGSEVAEGDQMNQVDEFRQDVLVDTLGKGLGQDVDGILDAIAG